MKVMRNFLTIVMISLMFISVNTFAQNGNGNGNGQGNGKSSDCGHSKGHGSANGKGIESKIPDLTEKQKTDIDKIFIDAKKEMLPITNELGVKRAELQTLRTAEKPNQKEIDAKVGEIGKLRTDMMSLRERRVQSIRTLLTDDQRVVFDSHNKGHKHSSKSDCGSKKSKKKCGGCK